MGLISKKNDKAYKALEVLIKQSGRYQTKVGWFKGNNYPTEDGGLPVAYVASIQEFGSPVNNIPPRPFMRPGVAKSEARIKSLTKSESKKIVDGNSNANELMQKIGELVKTAIYHEIATLTEPPLKEATIKARARKYSSQKGKITASLGKPLVDTKRMLNTLTYVVEEK